MKKNYLKTKVIITALVLLATTQSCQRESSHKQQIGHLIPLETDAKTENQYVLFYFLGHDASKCPGCLYIGGVLTHVECQGAGSACNKASNIALSYDLDDNLIATTLDTFGLTRLDILNLPAESFSLEIAPRVYSYLNIPAQLVCRDTVTQQFTFTGLFFTDDPEYTNE